MGAKYRTKKTPPKKRIGLGDALPNQALEGQCQELLQATREGAGEREASACVFCGLCRSDTY